MKRRKGPQFRGEILLPSGLSLDLLKYLVLGRSEALEFSVFSSGAWQAASLE